MDRTSPRWKVITTTEHTHEQLGLDLLRDCLPDQPPFLALANFEFVADSGHVYEVDALVVTPKGLFLVELKHWQGDVEGDPYTWTRTVEGRTWQEDNPLILANRKAKTLKSVLQRTPTGRARKLPFVDAVVCLTNPAQAIRLTPPGRTRICGPDGSPMIRPPNGIASITDTLVALAPDAAGRPPRTYTPQALADAAKAISEMGIRESQARRSVRDYVLGEVLEDGDVYQDYLATHRRFREQRRRIRIYPQDRAAGDEARHAARRCAEREFTLFAHAGHPGIETPLDFVDHERGPALIFDYDPTATRLDRWLTMHGKDVALDGRLALIRAAAEALAHAHAQRIFHRALDVRAIWVGDTVTAGQQLSSRLRVRNWHTAVRAEVGGTITRLPSSAATGISVEDPVTDRYRAPELRVDPRSRPRTADVFSLGALAFHILAGQEPAPNPGALDEHLRVNGGLALDAFVDGVDEALRSLIWQATAADVTKRLPSVDAFLERLDDLERAARLTPAGDTTTAEEEGGIVDPLEARAGDVLDGRFEVLRRLGSGATAVALLVADDQAGGAQRVLKVALNDDRAAQLTAEADVLARLAHPAIVRLIGDPLTIGGRRALLLARAGERTLSERIATDGPPGLELLERWGNDLLAAVAHLEECGLAHRDIKPDNIGVAEQGKNKELHLVVFDLSLARVPADELGVGTTGYVDPFLRQPGRGRWDTHAERFAAAVTLHQLATGELPRWGAEGVDPLMTDAEVTIDPARFDPALAGRFVDFFRTAFARDVKSRFGSIEDMATAWRRCFEPAAVPVPGPEPAPPRLDDATLTTPLTDLGLSNRATSALERAGLLTVGDLLTTEPFTLNRLRGVGKKTIAELRQIVVELRGRLGTPETTSVTAQPRTTIDLLATQLLAHADSELAARIARCYLGLHDPDPAVGPVPNQTQIAATIATTQATVSRVLRDLHLSWAEMPALNVVRDDLAGFLDESAGVSTAAQLADALLARRGSIAEEPARTTKGIGVTRAALEVETTRPGARWQLRRHHRRLLVAATAVAAPDDPGSEDVESGRLAWMARLGDLADTLADTIPPPPPAVVAAELRGLRSPVADVALDDRRLVALAAASSDHAAVSSRGELYRPGLPAAEALARAVGTLLGVRRLTPAELTTRIRARFPQAEALPADQASLDRLLADAGLQLRWEPTERAWVAPTLSVVVSTATRTTATPEAPEQADFDERLRLAHDSGRLLVLQAPTSRYRGAIDRLTATGVTPFSVDGQLISLLRDHAARLGIDWSVVLEADAAGAHSTDWRNLTQLVARAVPDLESSILATKGTVLLCDLGLLGRYGQLNLIDRLRSAVAHGTQPLRSLWVLVAHDGPAAGPSVDGHAIGVLTPNEWAKIPRRWIDRADAA